MLEFSWPHLKECDTTILLRQAIHLATDFQMNDQDILNFYSGGQLR